jgi:hypothetical protein
MQPSLKYGLIAALLLGVWGLHTYDKQKAVRTAKTAIVAEYNQKLLTATNKALEQNKQLQANKDKLKETKDEEISAISSQLTAALSELRKRPKRPTSLPNNPQGGEACTARELYQEDAEFLTREAARAESVLAERDYYYTQYESVRRSLEQASD